MSEPPVVEFDRAAARRFVPDPRFAKTAVLVDVVDPDAVTVLRATFGEQHMRGAFYAVDEGSGSYGAARDRFEATHRRDGPNRWVKVEPVLAYRATEACTVETHIDDHLEARVVADAGDWVVLQAGGEMMTVDPAAFADRYVADRT